MSAPHTPRQAICAAPKCDNPSPSAFLCFSCTDTLRRDLKAIPDLWAELDLTRTRQAKIVRDHVGSRSSVRPLPWNEHAAQIATELHATTNAWALDIEQRGMADERDPLSAISDDPGEVAAWLLRNFAAFNIHKEAGQAADEIGDAVIRARRTIDLPPDKTFAGPCGAELDPADPVNGKCKEDLYALPGKNRVFCMGCGAEHDLTKRREWMLGAIEDEVAHSGLLSGLVTNLGVPIASSTIRHYALKGRIKVISVDAKKRPLYRIGDVLDVFLKRAA